jgi:hypothetical protein
LSARNRFAKVKDQKVVLVFHSRTGGATGVESVLHALVLTEGTGAVPFVTEVVELPVDALLKSTVPAGLGGEAFDRLDLVCLCAAHSLP